MLQGISIVQGITYMDSLLEELHEFLKLKQSISLKIVLNCIISYYNQDYIIQELHT